VQPHQAERLAKVLDDHGLEALIATREANVAYVTDVRGIDHAVFETPQLAVFPGAEPVEPPVDHPRLSPGVWARLSGSEALERLQESEPWPNAH